VNEFGGGAGWLLILGLMSFEAIKTIIAGVAPSPRPTQFATRQFGSCLK